MTTWAGPLCGWLIGLYGVSTILLVATAILFCMIRQPARRLALAEASLGNGRWVVADPILDAWVIDDGAAPRVIPVADGESRVARSVESRVGEALLFTTLMAPWNRTRGSLSRFTCEACHFEGAVDGRLELRPVALLDCRHLGIGGSDVVARGQLLSDAVLGALVAQHHQCGSLR